jgi:N-acetyl-anhydromuramyl-L-alanine amidase AmpD
MVNHPLPSHGEMVPYGLMVHTTGDGLAQKCIDNDPIQVAIDVYSKMKEGAHYCIAPDGRVVKFRNPNSVTWHAGVSVSDRAAYLSGEWETNGRTPKAIVDWWKVKWTGKRSPQHLYPTKSPNACYVGIELIPCGVYQSGSSWTPLLGTPATPKGRYTAAQYTMLARLAVLLAERFDWPTGWETTSRLVGHSDVDPKDRPGWDPGEYNGWFSFSLLRGMISGLQSEVWL